jgi:hypothetical protein
MKRDTASYVTRLEAELRRLGAEKEQSQDILEEVFAELDRFSTTDLSQTFGPAEEYAQDALTGRRPLRSRYLRRLGTELAERGLPGTRVGQVLAEVDEYVRDSGQSPLEAFGPPDEYAERVVEAAGPQPADPVRSPPRDLLVAAGTTAGTLLAVEGVTALLRREPAPLTLGVVVAALVLPAVHVAAGRLVRRPAPLGIVAALVATVGGWLGQLAVLVWWRNPVLVDGPAVVVLVIGLVLVAAMHRASGSVTRTDLPEPVLDPRPGAPRHPAFEDSDQRDALVRRTARGAVVVAVVEIATLTVAVLLLR